MSANTGLFFRGMAEVMIAAADAMDAFVSLGKAFVTIKAGMKVKRKRVPLTRYQVRRLHRAYNQGKRERKRKVTAC